MEQRFSSKVWSCSDLVAGAAHIVDQMASQQCEMDVAMLQQGMAEMTEDMSAEELELLLKDFDFERLYCNISAYNPLNLL